MKRLRRVFPHHSMFRTAGALRHVWLVCLGMVLYSLLAVWFDASRYRDVLELPSEIYAAFSMVLGLLLVFRTNRVYERWWEARTLWGALVNVSRNLAVKVSQLLELDSGERQQMQQLITGFPVALAGHLRDGISLKQLKGFENTSDDPAHVPAYLSSLLYQQLVSWKRGGRISEEELRILEREARTWLEICGGCERIRNTPIAGSYRSFTLKCLLLYLVTLPWGLVHQFGYWTLPLVAVLSYLMVGLEAIAETVEEPFGRDLDDLPLTKLCATIDSSVSQILGQPPLQDCSQVPATATGSHPAGQ